MGCSSAGGVCVREDENVGSVWSIFQNKSQLWAPFGATDKLNKAPSWVAQLCLVWFGLVCCPRSNSKSNSNFARSRKQTKTHQLKAFRFTFARQPKTGKASFYQTIRKRPRVMQFDKWPTDEGTQKEASAAGNFDRHLYEGPVGGLNWANFSQTWLSSANFNQKKPSGVLNSIISIISSSFRAERLMSSFSLPGAKYLADIWAGFDCATCWN